MSFKRGIRVLLAVGVAGVLPACGNINDGHPPVPFTVRASVSMLGIEPDADAQHPRISGNGRYVVFASAATTLTLDDSGFVKNIFRHDLKTGVTVIVTVGFFGDPPDDDSDFPSISNDGRFVAFASFATNLVQAGASAAQVYVRDMDSTVDNGIIMVSEVSGIEGDLGSGKPVISGDGRYVAFESLAQNLAGTHPVPMANIYRRDLTSTEIIQVSVTPLGAEPTPGSASPGSITESASASISDDGSRIAFVSGCTDLVANDINGLADVFVANISALGTVTIDLASNAFVPEGADVFSNNPVISGDGKFVAFQSQATNLVFPDTSFGNMDIYVYDVDFPAVERVSVNSAGVPAATFDSLLPSISQDGRFVAFESDATNLVGGDTNNAMDVFVRDRLAGVTVRVSVNTSGNQSADGQNSLQPSISADGRAVSFVTDAPFVNADTNGLRDVYVRSPLR